MADIDEELLTRPGMAAAHAALIANYEWFLHIKPVRKFDAIKKGGLHPRSQGCPTNQRVAAAMKGNVDEMIFFRPLGTFDSTPRRGEKMFTMAIHRDALPATLTVDWTYGGTWGLASLIKADTPALTNEVIFCEVVRRRGSVAVYQTIPREVLKVWTKGQPADDPSKWPRLICTDIGEVEQFD
jgi:hypothetical protein